MRAILCSLVLGALVVGGCQSIAGIEDRHFDPLDDGGTGGKGTVIEASETCKKYCKDVMGACVGDIAQYADMDTCLAVCGKIPEGEAHEPGGNTIGCRETQAGYALVGEPELYCDKAGPGGGGTCGTDCQSYCNLFAAICSDQYDPLPDCEESCKALRVDPVFNPVASYMGDTLNCRLVHISAASLDPTTHCQHARVVPPTDPCADPPTDKPSCTDFCRIVGVACGDPAGDGAADAGAAGPRAVYESTQQCMDVCNALPRGLNKDMDGNNTVGCRKYHSYNAVADPVVHCPHTGPGGDGVCSTDNCESYCQLAAVACSTDFKKHFPGGADACKTECEALDGAAAGSGYNISTPDGNTVQCRLLRTARAFSDSSQCAAALGAAPCN
ncbi:MAG TPA: hypothetical protein VH062_24340 [Polyangiaceae bacterium]|jgi:hypothetical protein|nr:hypothetical protein [Polyangiaceae bacterium]